MYRISARLILAVFAIAAMTAAVVSTPLRAADAPAEKPKYTVTLGRVTGVIVDSVPARGPRGYGGGFGVQSEMLVDGDFKLLVVYPEVTFTWHDNHDSFRVNRGEMQVTSAKAPHVDPALIDKAETQVYRVIAKLQPPRYVAANIVSASALEYVRSHWTRDNPVDELKTVFGPFAYMIPTADLGEAFTLRLYDQEAKIEMSAKAPAFDPKGVLQATITGVDFSDHTSSAVQYSRPKATIRVRSTAVGEPYMLVHVKIDPQLKDFEYNTNEFALKIDGGPHLEPAGLVFFKNPEVYDKERGFRTTNNRGELDPREFSLVFFAPKDYKKLELFWLNTPLTTYTP